MSKPIAYKPSRRAGDKRTRFKSFAHKVLISTDEVTTTMMLESRVYFVDSGGKYIASFEADGIHLDMPSAPEPEKTAVLTFEDFVALHRETRWQPVLLLGR